MRSRAFFLSVLGVLSTACWAVGGEDMPLILLKFDSRLAGSAKLGRKERPLKDAKMIADLRNFSIRNYHAETATAWGRRFAPLGTIAAKLNNESGNKTFETLVSSGPNAIGLLVAEIGNTEKTKVRVDIQEKSVSLARILPANPLNRIENVVGEFGWQPRVRQDLEFENATVYEMRVGDVCALALGQIVGRYYTPFSSVSGGGPDIMPFSVAKELQTAIKLKWGKCDEPSMLCQSLIYDFYTRDKYAMYDSEIGDYRSRSSDGVCNAVLRLIYYFPDIGIPIACREIDTFPGDTSYHSGVQIVDFVKSISWCDDDRLSSSLEKLAERTEAPRVLTAINKLR